MKVTCGFVLFLIDVSLTTLCPLPHTLYVSFCHIFRITPCVWVCLGCFFATVLAWQHYVDIVSNILLGFVLNPRTLPHLQA